MLKRLVLILALVPAPALAAPWQLQPDTAVTVDVGWEGRTVQVRFPTLSGEIDFDKDHPERARATITVASADATTGVAVVDNLVRSRDYLGAAQYPEITFRLDQLTQTSKSTAEVEGRIDQQAVWSGKELIVYGGFGASPTYTKTDGARYLPGGSWTRFVAPADAFGAGLLTGRFGGQAWFGGGKMFIWGGGSGTSTSS